jgi:NTP pyrophosphatase (non-canonical NTP hydrolase)
VNANDYQKLAMRTDGTAEGQTVLLDASMWRLLNATLGLAGEAGEIADHLKKHLFHGHPLDTAKLSKEVGDQQWYVAQAADALGKLLGEIQQENVEKLRRRYPEGFSAEASLNRTAE